jgi:hypothetical protein
MGVTISEEQAKMMIAEVDDNGDQKIDIGKHLYCVS